MTPKKVNMVVFKADFERVIIEQERQSFGRICKPMFDS